MHKTEFCLNIYTDGRNTNLPYKFLRDYNVPEGGSLLEKVVAAHNAGHRLFIIYANGWVTDAPHSAYAQVRVTNNSRYIMCEWLNENSNYNYTAIRMIDSRTMQWEGEWFIPVSTKDIPYRITLESGKKYLVIYDTKTNAKLAHINIDAQF